ncbi:MAG: MATE family efflux transporter [Agathobacter sp.]|nr:MATE family efflux transporter [Agathobacter sp.]
MNAENEVSTGGASVNLAEGSIGKLLLKLALPATVAQVVNLLYNMVDRIFIGHIPKTGDIALTGLGLCFPILMLISAFASLVGSGGAPQAAIAMGKGDKKTAEKILGNCVGFLVVIAVILTIVLEFTAEPILVLFGASGKTLPYALSYIRIYVMGSLFVMLSLGLNTFITTQGFASVAMKTVIIGAACNIILDPILIFGLHMGVKGAALATIISQAVSAAWVILFLTGKKTQLRIKKEYLKPNTKILLPVFVLGVSPFIMQATESILNIAFNSSLSKYGGDVAVGAMTILASIMQFMMLPAQGLAQGAQPIMSFNYGAGNAKRVKETIRLLIFICTGYTLLFWAIIQLFPEVIVTIFNSESPELLSTTVWAIRIYIAVTGIFGIQMAIQQVFVSLGQAKLSLIVAILRKIVLLIPLIYILPLLLKDKVFAVFLAEPVADFISVVVCLTLFLANIKKILAKPAE